MITSTTKTIAAAFAVAAALGATTAQAATAKRGDGVRVAGTCSDASTSKLKVKRDNGRLAGRVRGRPESQRRSVDGRAPQGRPRRLPGHAH